MTSLSTPARERSAGALALAALGTAGLMLGTGLVVTGGAASASHLRFDPQARVAGHACLDANTSRYRIEFGNAGRDAATVELRNGKASRYVTTAPGEAKSRFVKVTRGDRQRVTVNAFDAAILDRTVRGRDCRSSASVGAVGVKGNAPLTLTNRTARTQKFVVRLHDEGTRAGSARTLVEYVPARTTTREPIGIAKTGTQVTVKRGTTTLYNRVRMAP